jgi:hypothetical protein
VKRLALQMPTRRHRYQQQQQQQQQQQIIQDTGWNIHPQQCPSLLTAWAVEQLKMHKAFLLVLFGVNGTGGAPYERRAVPAAAISPEDAAMVESKEEMDYDDDGDDNNGNEITIQLQYRDVEEEDQNLLNDPTTSDVEVEVALVMRWNRATGKMEATASPTTSPVGADNNKNKKNKKAKEKAKKKVTSILAAILPRGGSPKASSPVLPPARKKGGDNTERRSPENTTSTAIMEVGGGGGGHRKQATKKYREHQRRQRSGGSSDGSPRPPSPPSTAAMGARPDGAEARASSSITTIATTRSSRRCGNFVGDGRRPETEAELREARLRAIKCAQHAPRGAGEATSIGSPLISPPNAAATTKTITTTMALQTVGGGCPARGLPMLDGLSGSAMRLVGAFLGVPIGRPLRRLREFAEARGAWAPGSGGSPTRRSSASTNTNSDAATLTSSHRHHLHYLKMARRERLSGRRAWRFDF